MSFLPPRRYGDLPPINSRVEYFTSAGNPPRIPRGVYRQGTVTDYVWSRGHIARHFTVDPGNVEVSPSIYGNSHVLAGTPWLEQVINVNEFPDYDSFHYDRREIPPPTAYNMLPSFQPNMYIEPALIGHNPLDNCSICLEPLGKEKGTRAITSCRHRFHKDCIDDW